jgi:glycosyl transferase, family 25
MNVLIINLASAAERMAFQSAQMRALGFAFERIEAVSADDVDRIAAVPTDDGGDRIGGRDDYWNTSERPLKASEKACLLSHRLAWRRVVRSGRPALVLEDDAVLSLATPQLLDALEQREGMNHVTLEARLRKKWIGKTFVPIGPVLTLRRLYQDRSGAAAYVLWPDGAEKLLRRSARQAGLADGLICMSYELQSYQVEPACAVQLDLCAAYGIAAPIATVSANIGARPSVGRRRHIGFRFRRIGAQLRIGLNVMTRLRVAQRRLIQVDPATFRMP